MNLQLCPIFIFCCHSANKYLCPCLSFLISLFTTLALKKGRPLYLPLTKLSSEKAMAPYSSTLACKIPWMEEPGGLQSMGSLRVRHDWATSLSIFTLMHWRRKWQPTPVFLPGESQGRGAWWAAVYGVAQSRTQLKRLSSNKLSLGFPGGSDGKEYACNARDLGLILGSGRSPGEETGYPFQYSCLENTMDRGAWWVTAHGVARSQTWLSN